MEVLWAEAATPCLVSVMPRRLREDGNSKAFGGERPDLGLQGGFLMPVGQNCPKTAKLLVFHRTNPKFPRTNAKIPTLALEAFPMFAFARGTHDRGRCFPAFPRRDETPCPRSASLGSRFPALCCPRRSSPSPGMFWGHRWHGRGSSSPLPAPADSSSGGELRGKWDADAAGIGGNWSETIPGT